MGRGGRGARRMAINPYFRSANTFYETYRGPGPERARQQELDLIRLIELIAGIGFILFLVLLALLYG